MNAKCRKRLAQHAGKKRSEHELQLLDALAEMKQQILICFGPTPADLLNQIREERDSKLERILHAPVPGSYQS